MSILSIIYGSRGGPMSLYGHAPRDIAFFAASVVVPTLETLVRVRSS
jgi:hypothetical protein